MERILEAESMDDAVEAGEYDAADFSETDGLFVERALAMAPRAGLIVDLGCGNGKIPAAIAAASGLSRAICLVDMSVAMLAIAKRHAAAAGGRLWPVASDAKRLPLADGSADMIVSNSLVHHIANPAELFGEIRRVVKPGGPILIRDLFRPATEERLEWLVARYGGTSTPVQRRQFRDSLHAALTPEEVASHLQQGGLRGLRVYCTSDRHWSAERSAV